MYKVSPKPKRTIPIKTYFSQYILSKDNGTAVVVDVILFGDIRRLFFKDENELLADEIGSKEMGAEEMGADAEEMGAEEMGADEMGADEMGADEMGADEMGANDSVVGVEENNLDTEFFILPIIELDLGLLELVLGLVLLYGSRDLEERDREVILYMKYIYNI